VLDTDQGSNGILQRRWQSREIVAASDRAINLLSIEEANAI
jgi:hypothetical protein